MPGLPEMSLFPLPSIFTPMPLKLPPRPPLGWWAVLALCLIAGMVLHGDLDAFENPDGEKHVPTYLGARVISIYCYLGARALLAGGRTRTTTNRPEFAHPRSPAREGGRV